MQSLTLSLLLVFVVVSCSSVNANREDSGPRKANWEQISSLDNQIMLIESQLVHVNTMIDSAKSRKSLESNEQSSISNPLIETEIVGYEAQRADLESRKNILELQRSQIKLR